MKLLYWGDPDVLHIALNDNSSTARCGYMPPKLITFILRPSPLVEIVNVNIDDYQYGFPLCEACSNFHITDLTAVLHLPYPIKSP